MSLYTYISVYSCTSYQWSPLNLSFLSVLHSLYANPASRLCVPSIPHHTLSKWQSERINNHAMHPNTNATVPINSLILAKHQPKHKETPSLVNIIQQPNLSHSSFFSQAAPYNLTGYSFLILPPNL